VILTLKIKRLVFSSKNNTIISIKPVNLEINHKSAGTKFLEKKLKGSYRDSESESDSDSDSESKKKNNSKNKCKNNSKKQ
jgi:hypothetical protein